MLYSSLGRCYSSLFVYGCYYKTVYKCSAVAEMGDRLATIDMDRKLAGILIHPAVSPQRTWAENWGLCALPSLGRVAGSPPNTMWPGPRPTSVSSGILTHPTIWPQYTNVTDRQWSSSIVQTVLQTVAQKVLLIWVEPTHTLNDDEKCCFYGCDAASM